MQIEAYYALIKNKNCGWCGHPLGEQPILMIEHLDGWKVDGLEKLQWLFLYCPQCDNNWSLWELGVLDGRGDIEKSK